LSRNRATAQRPDLSGYRLGRTKIDIRHNDLRPTLRQHKRYSAPDAAPGSRDYSYSTI
jgi:hypothetical protein